MSVAKDKLEEEMYKDLRLAKNVAIYEVNLSEEEKDQGTMQSERSLE